MGCGASTSPVQHIMPTSGCDCDRLVLLKDRQGRRRCQRSIDYEESTQSFNSMTFAPSTDDPMMQPHAETHAKHLQKLEHVLAIIPGHEELLKQEVRARRQDMTPKPKACRRTYPL
ncbi:unnamed protein product [Effrenium voratum]|uniref:Uncharacterized protein n=1 Tax=Effrenium voratum TaxID=2562239 RepID=A0AA36J7C2_9DINO|nr:unnamed protein product [Effrenium voratum]CAJ1399864.1 unnamed protein product [Effrenium voratum]CAJ1438259.1 unnamed protein product [Effrenium voratum]|mmetsp:Transcript_132674/g.314472  ORF Transcript_132674/g.314472 Transcript_132674/m.314472 type:complete len:116 (-) Transcript_132674:46-393(-)